MGLLPTVKLKRPDGRTVIINASDYKPDGLNAGATFKDWKFLGEASNGPPAVVGNQTGETGPSATGGDSGGPSADPTALELATAKIEEMFAKGATKAAVVLFTKEKTGKDIDPSQSVPEVKEQAIAALAAQAETEAKKEGQE